MQMPERTLAGRLGRRIGGSRSRTYWLSVLAMAAVGAAVMMLWPVRPERPLLAEPSGKGRDAAFTLVTRGPAQYGQAVRTERWRYIRWSDGAHELYDEANDPQETHDVAGDPRRAARRVLRAFR